MDATEIKQIIITETAQALGLKEDQITDETLVFANLDPLAGLRLKSSIMRKAGLGWFLDSMHGLTVESLTKILCNEPT
jgi:hypothetical protein